MKVKHLIVSILYGLGLILAALWLLAGGPAVPVYADTFTVTTTAETGPGSLQQAILDANGNPGHDVIDFGVTGVIAMTHLTITLPTIDDDLTITGPGAAQLAVSGGNVQRVFEIAGGTAVTITGLTIRDGYVEGNGAGIWSGGALHLEGVRIVNNVAAGTDPNGYGGGVYVSSDNAMLNVSGGMIADNAASHSGGGMYVYGGSATLSETQVLNNSASYGGGINVYGGSATLSGTQVLSNSANYGGGVHVSFGSGMLKISEGEIRSNSAIAGGGVYMIRSRMALSETHVLSNSASSEGGGVYVYGGNTTLNETQVVSNSAAHGGGVYVDEGDATLHVSGGMVAGNAAENGGGLFSNGGYVTLTHALVANNRSTGDGGGVYALNGSMTLIGAQVLNNAAGSEGAGVFVWEGLTTIDRTLLSNNAADTYGGGVDVYYGTVILEGSQVSSNTASYGGGVYVWYGTATLTETQILTNVTAHNGGGILIYGDNAALTMTGGEIRRNNARGYGGGMYIDAGVATLHGTRVLSNTSTNHGGGVLVDKESAALTIDEGEINGNSGNYAGGVFINKGNVVLSRGSLDGNSAYGRGGGMFIGTGNATLSEMQVSGNEAALGGGAFINLGSATFTGTQILSNAARDSGGGVYILQGTATLTGAQVLSNTAVYHGGGLFAAYDTTTLTVTAGKIANNSATTFGGGVHVASANVTLSGTQILDNSSRIGGGLCALHSEARVHVIGGAINHNRASDTGGGVDVITGSVTLSGTQVFDNASEDGGGVYVYSGTVTLNSARVHSNTAGAQGGGVHVAHGKATLNQAQITGNAAPDGSALYTGGTISPTSALTITGDVYQAGGHFAGSDHDLRIEGALVLAGGDFYAPDEPNALTLTGPYTHTGGTYHQTKVVNGNNDVGFPKEGGLFINANNVSLGSTQVADTAGDGCIGTTPGEAVSHCFVITPTVSIWGDYTATLTLYYRNAEAKPGHDCNVMEAYAWDGTWDTMLTRDASYGDGGRVCGGDPQSIRVIEVSDFPTFTLRGPAPEIDVAPASLDFGEQAVDAGPALSRTVTISNTGLENLHVTGMALSGTDAADFTITGGDEAVTLTTHQTHTVHIIFDPASSGIKTAGLTIQSDDADESTVTVALSGTGTAPEITVAPPVLDFGEQDVDAGPAVSRPVTITNEGNVDLHVTGIALGGSDAPDFVIESGSEAVTLTAWSTHTIPLSFDPSTMGAKSAELQIQSDDGDEPTVTVPLSGTGASVPEIGVAPLSLDFGERDVDAGATLPQTVTIANEGSADLHISGVGLTGADAAEFVINGDTGEATLAPGATRTLHVSFDPSGTGIKSANLSIQSDDADEGTVNVTLSGTGTTAAFPLTVSKDGTGDGTVNSTPEGIDCGAACQAGFIAGTEVTLTATTDTGFVFAGWQGEGCSGTGACLVTMDTPRHVTATFNVAPGYSGYGSTPAPGSTINMGPTDVGSPVSATLSIFETGDVTLAVTPTLSGADAADFSVTPSTLTIEDGGAAQALTVTCTPSIAGTRAATLTVAHNAPGSPALYPLRCNGGTVQFIYLPLMLKH